MPIQPTPSSPPIRSPPPQVILRPNVPSLPIVRLIYAPSYAPPPYANYVHPTPRIFTHGPVFTAPPPVTASQEQRIPTPPPSFERQSPQRRIAPSPQPSPAPSPTLSSISSISSTDTDIVSKIKFSEKNSKNHKI